MNMVTRIAGIPCEIEVTHWFVQKPLGPRCDSDWDAMGYTECEFNVLDRYGDPAPWLERKMTEDDRSRIITELGEYRAERD